ncbi:hypothetical protein [Salinicola tamaricis]|nr:hypothetical protein [Salinicola tamaricis]
MLSASRRAGIRIALTGTHSDMRRMLFANGVRPPLVSYERSIEAAVNKLRRASAET